MAEGVKKAYKVAFKDPLKPENGFEYLYVSKDEYEKLAIENSELKAKLVKHDGEDVYQITDIIGSEPDLGVENLKGSGLIAGETSAAYEDVFTMTVVLGRYVFNFFCLVCFSRQFSHFLFFVDAELLVLVHTW